MSRQQRRNEIAQALGYKNAHDRRNAEARALGARNYAQLRSTRAAGKPLPGDTRAGRRQIVKTDAGTIVRPTAKMKGLSTIESQLRRAGNRQVFATVTVKTGDGPRTFKLFGKGGWSADKFRASIAALGFWGAVGAAIADGAGSFAEGQDAAAEVDEYGADAVLDMSVTIS